MLSADDLEPSLIKCVEDGERYPSALMAPLAAHYIDGGEVPLVLARVAGEGAAGGAVSSTAFDA